MSGSIFVLQDNGKLIEVREAAYDSEALLQHLLAKYPNLLAGDQMNSDDPRRWLLVTREMAVPESEGSAGRWSLDHLFLDQEAVPTLVEVKRSTDTRIRREVIGQLLDYAANAVVYWPVEKVRALFEGTCESEGTDPDEELAELLGEDGEPEHFWQQVKTNLQAGRIRLVFVADELPPALRRVIEFLNKQMDPTEVLGVEIKQYVGEGLKTLVPKVIGQSKKPEPINPIPTQREAITEQQFWEIFSLNRPADEVRVAKQIIEWSKKAGLPDAFKSGQKGAVYIPTLRHGDQSFYPFTVSSKGFIALQMRWLKNHAPFDDPATRDELRVQLDGLPGLRVGAAEMAGFPKIRLSTLTDAEHLRRVLRTLDWIIERIRSRPAAATGGMG